jgi:hypothetical protein
MTCLKCGSRSAKDGSSESEFIDLITIEFVFIDGGTFMMGDTFGEEIENELPVHEVAVSAFYMEKYPMSMESKILMALQVHIICLLRSLFWCSVITDSHNFIGRT